MGKNFCKVEGKWCKFLRRGVCQKACSSIDALNKCPRIAEIETVTFSEILKKVNFEDTFAVLCKFFPGQAKNRSGYEKAFSYISNLKVGKHYLNDLYILVEKSTEEYDGKTCEYLDTHGLDRHDGVKYAIEFSPWKDWVTMFVSKETLENLTNEEIVAGCLYEMTFFGYEDSAVQDKHQELINNIAEAKASYEKK